MTILIIADSRGRDLQELLSKLKPLVPIKVLTHPGSGAELAVLKSVPFIIDSKPDLVLMLTGICDLTWKHRHTKHIGLRHSKVEDNVSHVMEAISSAYDLLMSQGVKQISFATITGADLVDCNHSPRRHMTAKDYLDYCATTKGVDVSQSTLNDSVLLINKKIVIFNRNNSVRTTWLAGLVHSYYKNKYHHCYKRLIDGCHPDPKTKEAWAAQIVKTIRRILSQPPPS